MTNVIHENYHIEYEKYQSISQFCSMTIDDKEWKYVVSGQGEKCLVLLPSGLANALPDAYPPERFLEIMKIAEQDYQGLIDKSVNIYYREAMNSENKKFIRKLIAQFKDRATRENVLGLYRLSYDYFKNYRFSIGDLRGWPGRVIVMLSDNDNGMEAMPQCLPSLCNLQR